MGKKVNKLRTNNPVLKRVYKPKPISYLKAYNDLKQRYIDFYKQKVDKDIPLYIINRLNRPYYKLYPRQKKPFIKYNDYAALKAEYEEFILNYKRYYN